MPAILERESKLSSLVVTVNVHVSIGGAEHARRDTGLCRHVGTYH